eukprot:symbB.v1.2.009391.t1/scaffold531.1/size191016/3
MASPLTRWKFLVISVPPISRSCGVACRARRGTVTMASPLQQAVLAAGTLAASLSGRGARRKPSEVTLDPKTAECAQTISSVLATVQEPSTDPQMVKDVVQALSAFAKMRVLHTEILRVFRDLPTAVWQDMPSELMVEAITSYAQFQLEDVEFHRFLARILVDRDLSLKGFELANLAFAVATLELSDLDSGIYPYFQAAFEKANVSRWSSFDLCRSLWSLARLNPSRGSYDGKAATAMAMALESKGKIFGLSLAQALWALPRLGCSQQGLLKANGGVVPGASLTDQAVQLRQMAYSCESLGLQAAVLNAAALRYIEAKDLDACEEILQMMAEKELWTPVTYCLAKRVGSKVTGSPPLPGMRTPGPKAHKYVRALYHALSRAKPNDISSALMGLEHFSRGSKRNWLKFGAADEKGQILEDAWASQAKIKEKSLALEFGTFLGYSAVKMWRMLGKGSKVISLEMDPEVACLALNFIEFAGLSHAIEVRIGQCEEVVEELKDELDPRSVDVVYMDHNQMTYHKDLAQLQRSRMLSTDVLFAATQGLKPGAPLLLWQLAEAKQAGIWSELDFVSCPDCGFRRMEDWVVLARGNAATTRSLKKKEMPKIFPQAPREVLLLAAECNLMRWRTAKGMVDEKRWDEFVQYVRRGMEKVGIRSSKEAWPDMKSFQAARELEYHRLDY